MERVLSVGLLSRAMHNLEQCTIYRMFVLRQMDTEWIYKYSWWLPDAPQCCHPAAVTQHVPAH